MLREYFDRPIIMGAIGGPGDDWRATSRELFRYPKKIVHLPLSIDIPFLKKIMLCMKLMDIAGLTIAEEHQRTMPRYFKNLDRIAKASGLVDTIIMRRQIFTGFDAKGLALQSWLKEFEFTSKGKRALIVGDHPFMRSFRAALLLDGWKLMKSATAPDDASLIITGKIPRRTHERLRHILRKTSLRPLHIELDKNAKPLGKKGGNLKLYDFMKLLYRTSAILLTSDLKL